MANEFFKDFKESDNDAEMGPGFCKPLEADIVFGKAKVKLKMNSFATVTIAAFVKDFLSKQS